MNQKILVIDDAPDAILLVHKHLAHIGDVLAATSGQEGLALARRSRPDIILLDVQMAGMDGFEVLSELKGDAATADIPVIMVTASDDPESESGFLECGAADFLSKPLNPETLKARVIKELKLARQRQQIETSNQLLEQTVAERTEQLLLAKEAAEAAARAKSNFLGNMSHEMKTPLHQALGLLHMLERTIGEPAALARLEQMRSALERLSSMTDGILKVVELESRTLEVEIAPIDVKEILAEALVLGADRARQKGLVLESVFTGTNSVFYGDRRLILIALNCYISNALTYTERGRIDVAVEVVEDRQSSSLLKFSVRDSGCGIAAAALPRLFELFEQGDDSSTRKFGGTGLGLYLVRKLAQELGGNAGCNSVVGEGSTFWFSMRLPILVADTGNTVDWVI